MATKTFKVSLSLDNPRIIQSGINVRSFDKQSIKISIELTKNSQVYQIPTGAQIKISLLKLARQEQKIILDVPFTSADSIDWIVPEYLDGYQGEVRVGVYLIVGTENIDVGYFNITSSVSDIDSAAEEFTESVLQGWAIEDLTALLPQFQAVLDETTGKDVISAPEIILARDGATTLGERLDSEKAEVSAQLAQKATKGDIGLDDLNKNKTQFDETWMTDEFKSQMSGNTPIHATPADGSLTTKKYADNSVTVEKIDDKIGLIERVTHEMVRGAHRESTGEFSTPNIVRIATTEFIPSNLGEKIVLKGSENADKRLYVFEYDDNLNYLKFKFINQHATDRYIEMTGDGYVHYNIGAEGTTYPVSDEMFNELSESVYHERYTLKALSYERNKNTNDGFEPTTINLKLPLEAHGLDKATGTAIGTAELLDTDNFNDMQRTGKYLRTIPSSNISLKFTNGRAFVFEYDKDFAYLGSTELQNAVSHKLGNASMIKIMLEGLTVNRPIVDLTFEVSGHTHEWIYNDFRPNRPISSIRNHSFVYETATNEGRTIFNPTMEDRQYTTTRYFNTGILKLPPNYDPFGEPVKLIIYCQGSSSYLGFDAGYIALSDENNLNYLADEGYAVFGAYRKTTKYAGLSNNASNVYAMATTVSALVSGYKHVVKNFNISKTGVFVSGVSSGGFDGGNLSYNMGVPVLATGLLAPTFNPLGTPYGSHEDARLIVADDFGFEGDHSVLAGQEGTPVPKKTPELREYMVQNAEKMIGYNPWWNGMIGENPAEMAIQAFDGTIFDYDLNKDKKKIYPNPIKIWYAKDDDRASIPEQIPLFAKMIQNTQGNIELRVMPNGTGGHGSIGSGEQSIKVPSITTRLGIEHTNVPLSFVELVQYFRRFEN